MKKINFRPLFYSAVMFGIGLALARHLFVSAVYTVFAFMLILALCYVCIKFKCFKKFVLLGLVFLVGVGYFFVSVNIFKGSEFTDSVFIEARVGNINSYNAYSLINLDDVKINGKSKNFCISLSVSGDIDISIGDRMLFDAKLKQIELFDNDGNYNSYFYKNNIRYKCTVDASKIVVQQGNLKLDESIRKSFYDFLNNKVDDDIGALITCVIFGDKTELDDSIDNVYTLSGMAHLLAVSGMHIMILVKFLTIILDKLKTKKYINFIILFVLLLFFTYLCDFSPSIVRAFIMSLVFYFASVVGKKYDKLNSLALCALLILLFKPLYIFDAGFLLSFFCVYCIFTLNKPLTNLFTKLKLSKKSANNLAVVTGVQLGLIPVLAIYFNSFNIFSLIINIICVPIFEFAFILTFVFVPICVILPFMSFILKFLEFIYTGVTLVASYVGRLTFANIDLPKSNIIFVITSYASIFICSRYVNLKTKTKAVSVCFILALGFFAIYLFMVL